MKSLFGEERRVDQDGKQQVVVEVRFFAVTQQIEDMAEHHGNAVSRQLVVSFSFL